MASHPHLLQHVTNILHQNYKIRKDQFILLVYDLDSPLSRLLAEAYMEAIKTNSHEAINFTSIPEEAMIQKFESLPPHSLVILVQSLSFRTTKYRLRADLFRMGHQVIEHARLGHNKEEEIENYINALKYDTPYYVRVCNAIEQLLLQHKPIRIESGDGMVLMIDPPFEKAIKNTGDFTDNPTASTGFPIGEIFTEAKILENMSGSVLVFGFPTIDHLTEFTEPFTVTIEKGRMFSHTGPAKFEEMMCTIKKEEGVKHVNLREIGFGLNRGLGFHHRVTEPTSFERFCGMHFSLGLKHNMYRRKLKKDVMQKYHVDIFCLVGRVFIGDTLIFEGGEYLL